MSLLSERALRRIREEMRAKRISQPDLASMMGTHQSWISKLMTGFADLKLDTLAEICLHLGLPVSEVIRDQGMEWYAEMTPTEKRVFDAYRALTPDEKDLFERLLYRARPAPPVERRHATEPKPKPKKP